MTGKRRRYSRTVHGSPKDAESALARLRVEVEAGTKPMATNARSVRAACELYLRDARTERTTLRTDRSGINRLCATALPGGRIVGDLPLSRLGWQTIDCYAAWENHISPQGRANNAPHRRSARTREAGQVDHVESRERCPATSGAGSPSRRARGRARRPRCDRGRARHLALRVRARTGDHRLPSRELLALELQDLDLRRGVVTIRAALADGGPGYGVYCKTTKRNDWRDVPLTDQMVEVLTELLAQRRAAVAAKSNCGRRASCSVTTSTGLAG